MGMDVYGNKPDAPVGEYFRRNMWGWRPLWGYIEDEHEELASRVPAAQWNDGDGLNAANSKRLARVLKEDLKGGRVALYVKERNQQLAEAPDLECSYCQGTGDRKHLEPPEWKAECGGCKACHGTGKVRPFETMYFLEENDVKEFAEFLEHCGGFEIW